MQEDANSFTHIAVCGISGVSIGAPIAIALNKNLIVVRKADDLSHSHSRVEGVPIDSHFNYVFLDDFISSGRTLARVHRLIDTENSYARIVNVYQYDEERLPVWSRFDYTLKTWEDVGLEVLDQLY
jgi:adenine/guanine phosphoribosyltransferase-like PRPP-binding protein